MNIAYLELPVTNKNLAYNLAHTVLLIFLLSLSTLALAIDTPSNVRGTEVRPGVIKWEWDSVNGAERYDVIINGQFKSQISDTAYYSHDLGIGEHSVMVRAINSNWDYSGTSQKVNGRVDKSASQSKPASAGSDPTSSIQAPRDVRGTEVRSGVIKWEWAQVPGASRYEITINGSVAGESSDLQYRSESLGGGDHSMFVKAIDGNGGHSAPSETVYRSLGGAPNNPQPQANNGGSGNNGGQASSGQAIPQDVRGTEVRPGLVKWEWARADGAAQYQVTIDGQNYGLTSELQYRLIMPIGEHFMSVQAVSAEGQHSDSSKQARRYVEGTPQGSDLLIQPPAPSSAPPVDANDNGPIDPASWSYTEIYQKDGYELAFSDEFNTNTLNRNRWNTQLRWDGSFNGERYEYRTINRENQFYVNIYSDDQEHLSKIVPEYNPFELDGSRLAIRAKRNPLKRWDSDKSYGPLGDMVAQQDFLSGAISTYDKFSRKYGYFEARIKIPSSEGTFPAFWLHHQRRENENTQKTEIDIMENLGHRTDYIYNTFHYFTGVSEGVTGNPTMVNPQPSGQIYTGTDWSQDYHVYAAEWKPGYIRWLIDGQTVSEVWSDRVDHEELYLILNLAVGGRWINYPTSGGGNGRDSGNRFPNQNDINNWSNPALEIDYVRAYKRK